MEDLVYVGLDILYQGSIMYVWKAFDFHAKCDNKGETIAVIWSTGGFISGVFFDKRWKSSGKKWRNSDKDLLLSLKIP